MCLFLYFLNKKKKDDNDGDNATAMQNQPNARVVNNAGGATGGTIYRPESPTSRPPPGYVGGNGGGQGMK
jgi:hypothetical protein